MYFSVEQLGNRLLIRDDNIAASTRGFKPTLFQPTQDAGDWTNIYGENFKPVQFDDMSSARDFINSRKRVTNSGLHGNQNFPVQYIAEHYKGERYDFDAIRIFTLDIEVVPIELDQNGREVQGGMPKPDEAKYPITSISVHDNHGEKKWIQWGTTAGFTPKDDEEYRCFESEHAMLLDFLHYWNLNCPHIVVGWNSDSFDIPYIVNRSSKVVATSANLLSPFGKVSERNGVNDFGQEEVTYHIYGVQSIDYMKLYKKFTYTMRENNRLDTIGEIECGINKLSFGDHANFVELLRGDPQLFHEYNRHDVQIILSINEKLRLLELAVEMAYSAGINYSDVFSPMRVWDAKIYNKLMERKITIPIPDSKPNRSYAGGYVKSPQLGLKKWIMSFDLASLYPSIIRGWNLGMETKGRKEQPFDFQDMLDGNVQSPGDDSSYSANGYLYDNDKQSLYSVLMEDLYAERKDAKNEMLALKVELQAMDATDVRRSAMETKIKALDTQQMGKKILLNSFYGILALKHFRFFDVDIAESITLNGQMAIRFIAERTSEYLNFILSTEDVDYVIAIDTDSQYIDVEACVDIFMKKNPDATTDDVVGYLDKVGHKLNKFIDAEYSKLQKTLNLKEQQLIMDREGIFGHEVGTGGSAGFWTAKKRYVLQCYDMEGVRYAEPYLKIMGLETQRSNSPKVFKTALKEMFREIVVGTNDSFIDKIDDFRKQINEIDLNDIAFPTSVNNIDKYTENGYPIKGAPGHVRAAITHNRLIMEDPKLRNEFPLITSGEKALLVNLIQPNPTGEKTFAYVNKFPEATGLGEYIDREAILYKGFIKPLEMVVESIGWETEHRQTLDSFFG